MSWSVNIVGDADAIGKEFDATRDRAAASGMVKAEQSDIEEARDIAMHLADSHGKLWVNAHGHWAMNDPDTPLKFGNLSITITPAPTQ